MRDDYEQILIIAKDHAEYGYVCRELGLPRGSAVCSETFKTIKTVFVNTVDRLRGLFMSTEDTVVIVTAGGQCRYDYPEIMAHIHAREIEPAFFDEGPEDDFTSTFAYMEAASEIFAKRLATEIDKEILGKFAKEYECTMKEAKDTITIRKPPKVVI